jgi:hypothetical protein
MRRHGQYDSNGWLIEPLHSHLSDDETVAKMGHPFVMAGGGEQATARAKTETKYGDSSLRSE